MTNNSESPQTSVHRFSVSLPLVHALCGMLEHALSLFLSNTDQPVEQKIKDYMLWIQGNVNDDDPTDFNEMILDLGSMVVGVMANINESKTGKYEFFQLLINGLNQTVNHYREIESKGMGNARNSTNIH